MIVLAELSLGIAVACALVIAVDEVRRPQAIGVMNVVWPVTALYLSVFALWAYFAVGVTQSRASTGQTPPMGGMQGMQPGKDEGGDRQPPTMAQIGLATSHCGAGCMIADVATEFAIAGSGLMLFGSMLKTEYMLDFVAAWALGIVFQYFSLKPMRPELTVRGAIWAVVKADTLSILAFQVGMYLFMAPMHDKLSPPGHPLTPFDPRYWLGMQVAMICGYLTSFPMNRFLVTAGLKERM